MSPSRRTPGPAPRALALRPAARADILAIATHYRADAGLGIALAFTDALQRTLHGMAHRSLPGEPDFAEALDMPGLRAWPLHRFPHYVFAIERAARDGEGPVDVLRVLHSKRDLPAAFRAG